MGVQDRTFARTAAGWCVRRRWLVLGAWLVALVVLVGLGRAVGSDYSNSFSLPGTGSAQAVALLESASPGVAGDSEQVVFETTGNVSVGTAAVQARVRATLAKVAKVPGVTRVVSPYSSSSGQISRDRRVGFAVVTFCEPFANISAQVGKELIAAARSGDEPGLRFAVSGQVAESASQASPALGTILGVLAAGVVLALVFGSLVAMVLPLLTALFSLGIAISVVELCSHLVGIPNVASEFILLIGLGVAVDYSLFIVTRYRQGLLEGGGVEESIVTAVLTSGRAVLFAGTIVCIAVLGMLVLGIGFFTGLAIAVAVAVALTMLAALTLLPALLSLVGRRALSRRRRSLPAVTDAVGSGGFWSRWAAYVTTHPILPALAAVTIVVVVAVPFFSLRLGSVDQGSDPPGTTTRQAYDMLVNGFGPGYPGPLQLAADLHGPEQTAALRRVVTETRRQQAVASVPAPSLIRTAKGTVALVTVYPTTSPQSAATAALVTRLRRNVIPTATATSGLRVYVGGTTATFVDFAHVISGKLALFIAAIVALSFLVLAAVFRSLVIPLTAAVMNVLSAGAAYGVMVAVFQWGWLKSIFGVTQTAPIESFIPLLMFAILFGLSMDYQVFLLTRIHEAWHEHHDNRHAVQAGLARSGRTITAAALIMILVFASFIFGGDLVTKQFGLGLAAAVLIDAIVIRSALVPALMLLLGNANWWFPAWLDRALPHITIETNPSSQSEGSNRD